MIWIPLPVLSSCQRLQCSHPTFSPFVGIDRSLLHSMSRGARWTRGSVRAPCPWEADPQWKHWVAVIAEARFPALPMLELCAGAGGAHHAANILLGDRVVTVGQWDFDARLDAVLRKGFSCEELAPVHTGPEEGDILRLQPSDLPGAFFIPFGPPCPPWPAMGKNVGFDDPRT